MGNAADWQRIQYNDNAAITPIYPATLRARKYMDLMEDQYNQGSAETINLEVTVPPDGLVEIDYLPVSSPVGTALRVYTDAGKTSEMDKITGNAALSANQVRVYPGQPFLDFHTSLSGDTVYVTVQTAGSVLTATTLNRLYAELSAMSAANTLSSALEVTAGELIPADSLVYFAYESGDIKCYLADNSDDAKCARGYVSTETALGATATIIMSGIVTNLIGVARNETVPDNTSLFLSNEPGFYTWTTDTNATYKLGEGQVRQYVGYHIHGQTGYIHVIGNPFYGA